MDMKSMPVYRFEVFISDKGNITLFPFTQREEYAVARRSAVYHTIQGTWAKYIMSSEQQISRQNMIEIAARHHKGEFRDVNLGK